MGSPRVIYGGALAGLKMSLVPFKETEVVSLLFRSDRAFNSAARKAGMMRTAVNSGKGGGEGDDHGTCSHIASLLKLDR